MNEDGMNTRFEFLIPRRAQFCTDGSRVRSSNGRQAPMKLQPDIGKRV